MNMSLSFHDYTGHQHTQLTPDTTTTPSSSNELIDASTQTDLTMTEIAGLEQGMKQVVSLQEKLEACKWSVQKIRDNDQATRFYTGLPTFAVFMWLYR